MPEILNTEGYSWEKGISLVSIITFFPNKLQQIAGVFNIAREIAVCTFIHIIKSSSSSGLNQIYIQYVQCMFFGMHLDVSNH